jgi:hypothetical protein
MASLAELANLKIGKAEEPVKPGRKTERRSEAPAKETAEAEKRKWLPGSAGRLPRQSLKQNRGCGLPPTIETPAEESSPVIAEETAAPQRPGRRG